MGSLENVGEWVRVVGKMVYEFMLEVLLNAYLQAWLQALEESSRLFQGGNAALCDQVARD
jgi:hypothetical protein